ncbi:MAG: hypothetical protein B7Y39_15835 [Bdellovibrio sp. 28-41-41]|nr:MAG: hypothetical protein B7Y39_15835 [Bdellovibrio sp. 28-41-41]
MVIQKLKLHEWFLVYQLDHIKRHGNFLPTQIQLDISAYVNSYEQRGQKFPLNAVFVKMIGDWAAANPEAHKMMFRTWSGLKFLFGDEIRINMPIEIKHEGRSVVTAIVIRNPQNKTVEQINRELRTAKEKSIHDFPITKFAYLNSNTFYNRWLLKGLHKIINSSPNLYWKKGGGCLSVSSLSNVSKPDMPFSTFSFGPTGLTFFYKDIVRVENRSYLNLSIGVDHNCYTGIEMVSLLNRLIESFRSGEQKNFNKITQDVHI